MYQLKGDELFAFFIDVRSRSCHHRLLWKLWSESAGDQKSHDPRYTHLVRKNSMRVYRSPLSCTPKQHDRSYYLGSNSYSSYKISFAHLTRSHEKTERMACFNHPVGHPTGTHTEKLSGMKDFPARSTHVCHDDVGLEVFVRFEYI